jgi:hypothetical protein
VKNKVVPGALTKSESKTKIKKSRNKKKERKKGNKKS